MGEGGKKGTTTVRETVGAETMGSCLVLALLIWGVGFRSLSDLIRALPGCGSRAPLKQRGGGGAGWTAGLAVQTRDPPPAATCGAAPRWHPGCVSAGRRGASPWGSGSCGLMRTPPPLPRPRRKMCLRVAGRKWAEASSPAPKELQIQTRKALKVLPSCFAPAGGDPARPALSGTGCPP